MILVQWRALTAKRGLGRARKKMQKSPWVQRLLQVADGGRRLAVVWLYIVFTRCGLTALVVIALSALLFLVPQANEALFGLLAPITTSGPLSPFAVGGLGRAAFVSIAMLLGMAVWYSARMLCTVDAPKSWPDSSNADAFDTRQSTAIEWAPRWLGTLSVSAIFGAGLFALLSTGAIRWYSAIASFGLPVAFAAVTQWVLVRGRYEIGWLVCAPLLAALGVLLLRAEARTGLSLIVIAVLILLPAMLHWFSIRRRGWLQRFGLRRGIAAEGGPAHSRSLAEVWGRLVLCAFAAFSVLLAFALLPANATRAVGSVNVVLLFLMAVVLAGAAIVIAARRLVLGTPILGLVFGTVAIATLFFRQEPIGVERLRSDSKWPLHALAVSNPGAKDIVVNARGGGLRAAVYTAAVLADLDDQSCGHFGDRLGVISGVSGGSLGAATYLLARQHFVASHHWDACTPSRGNPRDLRTVVEAALLQDHLSPALAHMLSEDLWPLNRPSRGQALLDSWESSLQAAIPAAETTLAMPIELLNGGIPGGVDVYFNSTDARGGKAVWFSNVSSGTVQFDRHQKPVSAAISIGEAVLHSARFPIVSPAGAFAATAASSSVQQQAPFATLNLVDGGYVDNSGADTLANHLTTESKTWLDLDGNSSESECKEVIESGTWLHWTAVGALLAVRSAQADSAVDRLERTANHPDLIELRLSLKQALKAAIKDETALCKAVLQRRSAPLGWYFAVITGEQMHPTITDAASTVCGKVPGLCEHH